MHRLWQGGTALSHWTILPSDLWVGCVAPRLLLVVRVAAIVVLETFAGIILWGPRVLVWDQRAPLLTDLTGNGGRHGPTVGLALACVAMRLDLDSRGRSLTAADVAISPASLAVGRYTPWPGLSIWIPTVVFLQVFIWKTGWVVAMLVWCLCVPALARGSVLCVGDSPAVVLAAAEHAILWTFTVRNSAVFPSFQRISGVAPGSCCIIVRISAEVFLQVGVRITFRRVSRLVWLRAAPTLASSS